MDLENGFDHIMLAVLLSSQKTEESKRDLSTNVKKVEEKCYQNYKLFNKQNIPSNGKKS